MSVLPSVRAELAERFILNFRMPPDALRQYLPAPWLIPQEVNGFAIASYCLLDLRNLTVAPLPTAVGLHSVSCAPRYAIIDTSTEPAKPAVFVTERQTNSAFGAWFTSLGFSAPHPYVKSSIERQGQGWQLSVQQPDDQLLFAAHLKPTPELNSQLFASIQEFADFIAQGISSYGLSRYERRLTKLDLHKQDSFYEPLIASDVKGPIIEEWLSLGATLDSAFRTAGGRYEWDYLGLTDELA